MVFALCKHVAIDQKPQVREICLNIGQHCLTVLLITFPQPRGFLYWESEDGRGCGYGIEKYVMECGLSTGLRESVMHRAHLFKLDYGSSVACAALMLSTLFCKVGDYRDNMARASCNSNGKIKWMKHSPLAIKHLCTSNSHLYARCHGVYLIEN